MTLRYTVTPADYGDFTNWYYQNVAGKDIIQRTLPRTCFLVSLVVLIGWYFVPHAAPYLVAEWVVAMAVILLWLPHRHRENTKRLAMEMYTAKENTSLFGDRSIEITPDGILTQSETTTSLHKWALIDRIVVSENYAYFLIGTLGGLVINRDTVTEGNFAEFIAESQRFHAQSQQTPVPIAAL